MDLIHVEVLYSFFGSYLAEMFLFVRSQLY